MSMTAETSFGHIRQIMKCMQSVNHVSRSKAGALEFRFASNNCSKGMNMANCLDPYIALLRLFAVSEAENGRKLATQTRHR